MKSFALVLICVACGANAAQLEPRTLKWKASSTDQSPMYSAGWDSSSIVMPVVTDLPPQVAARINDALFISQMRIPAPTSTGKVFTLPSGATPEGITELEYKSTRNDTKILEIEFSGESCGAYCETFTDTKDFDVRTGRTITIADLLTPAAQTQAVKLMQTERKRQYQQQIAELKKEKQNALIEAKKTGKKADLEETEERITFNQDCLAQENSRSDFTIDYLTLSLPTPKSLTLTSGRCSAHVNRALDDVDQVSLTLGPKELASMLTPYGQAFLLDIGDASAPNSIDGQVLYGKLGTAAITVVFNQRNSDGSVSANYYYDKYRKLISLTGKLNGKSLTLTEQVSAKEVATINLELGKTEVTGSWLAAGKKLPVQLSY